MARYSLARGFAVLISVLAWAGLAIQFQATFAAQATVIGTAWILARFFTVLANLLVALVFGSVALGWRRIATPSLLGCSVVSIILVGVVYGLLLRGLLELSGGAAVADMVLHKATPMLAPLWWLAFGRRGRLTAHDPWLWALWPLAYLVYALARGTVEGRFAYPFLDYARNGWGSVAAYGVVIAAGFVLLGQAMVWLDRQSGSRGV